MTEVFELEMVGGGGVSWIWGEGYNGLQPVFSYISLQIGVMQFLPIQRISWFVAG